MSLLVKAGVGITKLSELIIDADKDWQAKGITNLKELASAMAKGDLAIRNNVILQRFIPGGIGLVLTSDGPGHRLAWAPCTGTPLERYIAAWIELNHAEAIVEAAQSHNENAPITSEHKQAYEDAPEDMIRRKDVAIALADAEAIVEANQAIAKTITLRSGLSILCDGFVEETAAAVQTDHTTEAREVTANDLNLNPMSDTVLDKIYIGSNYKFWQAQVQVGTSGVGNWTNAWYYWNGVWTPAIGEVDGAVEWQFSPGLRFISHTPQADWGLKTIQGMNLYWLMSRTDNFVSRTTKPLGSQIWVAIA